MAVESTHRTASGIRQLQAAAGRIPTHERHSLLRLRDGTDRGNEAGSTRTSSGMSRVRATEIEADTGYARVRTVRRQASDLSPARGELTSEHHHLEQAARRGRPWAAAITRTPGWSCGEPAAEAAHPPSDPPNSVQNPPEERWVVRGRVGQSRHSWIRLKSEFSVTT